MVHTGIIKLEAPRHMPDWLGLYRLYRAAFPPEERKPFFVIRRMYRQGRAHVWCIRKGGKLAGMAATVNSDDLILLDYLAVSASCRGQGIGSAAMKLLLKAYAGKGLFVEIESTLEESPDRTARLKRKGFYQQCGLTPFGVSAKVFGVNMELLGVNCHLTFDDYRSFYREHYSSWAAEHILPR